VDESLPGPWNTYISARKEGTAGEGLKEKERGRPGGLRVVPKVEKEGSRWSRGEPGPGALGPVAKGIGLCVHEAYPKGGPT